MDGEIIKSLDGQMLEKQRSDAREAILTSQTEDELASWRRRRGVKVISHAGRYWEAKPGGFYHAIHWMARMTMEEATKPTPLCWGFRTTLCDAHKPASNATMPVHILADVDNYDMSALSSKRRNKVRNCYKRIRIVEVLAPDLLKQQGYDVLVSAHQRTGYGKVPNLEQYRKDIDTYFYPKSGLILAGLIDERLGGYVIASAVGATAYIDSVQIASNALPTNIGTGLIFELIQACRRAGTIREAVYGLHSREDQALCHFKEGMGFPVVHIPARVWFAPLLKAYIKNRRPDAYYRLTGRD